MTLNTGETGQAYEVLNFTLPTQTEKRLQALGMTMGTKILVMNNKNHGTIVIKLRGTRFALGKGISSNITVRRLEQ